MYWEYQAKLLQTDLVTSACMLSSECLCLDTCPIYLWFYVGALKAAFISSFSGITHFITYISAACAFITRDQPLSSPRQLSAQARSHSQIQSTSTTYLSSAGGRSRLPFEDVLKLLYSEERHLSERSIHGPGIHIQFTYDELLQSRKNSCHN